MNLNEAHQVCGCAYIKFLTSLSNELRANVRLMRALRCSCVDADLGSSSVNSVSFGLLHIFHFIVIIICVGDVKDLAKVFFLCIGTACGMRLLRVYCTLHV